MITQDKLNRKKALIERLLAKAGEATNPAEAEIAMQRAEKMMVQYGFDKAEFAGADKPAEMTTMDIPVKGIYDQAKANMLFTALREYKTVSLFRTKLGSRTFLTIVGEKSDVYDMGEIAFSLLDQSDIAMKQWWLNHPLRGIIPGSDAYKARREFFFGFGRGAGDRVSETLAEAVAEDTTGSREIVIRDRVKKAEEYVAERFNLTPGRKSRVQGSRYAGDAYSSGKQAGRTANIGTKVVAG